MFTPYLWKEKVEKEYKHELVQFLRIPRRDLREFSRALLSFQSQDDFRAKNRKIFTISEKMKEISQSSRSGGVRRWGQKGSIRIYFYDTIVITQSQQTPALSEDHFSQYTPRTSYRRTLTVANFAIIIISPISFRKPIEMAWEAELLNCARVRLANLRQQWRSQLRTQWYNRIFVLFVQRMSEA